MLLIHVRHRYWGLYRMLIPVSITCTGIDTEISTTAPTFWFIHSGYFYSTSSSSPLLRGAPDTAWILCRSFTSKSHMRVKDLSTVPTWQLEQDSSLQTKGGEFTNEPSCHNTILVSGLKGPYSIFNSLCLSPKIIEGCRPTETEASHMQTLSIHRVTAEITMSFKYHWLL